jgi:hypothetical protein
MSVVQRKGAGHSITEGALHITKKVVGMEMMKGNEWVAYCRLACCRIASLI